MEKELYDFKALELVTAICRFVEPLTPKLDGFTCSVICDWNEERKGSRGGLYRKGPGINLAMHRLKVYKKDGIFHEYVSFQHDPYIGSIKSDGEMVFLWTLVCHEVSHAIVSYLNICDVHGPNWKHWYRILREKYINHLGIVGHVDRERTEPNVENERAVFNSNCKSHGLCPEHFGSIFTVVRKGSKEESFKVTGWNPRARKHFVKIQRLSDGSPRICPPNFVKTHSSI